MRRPCGSKSGSGAMLAARRSPRISISKAPRPASPAASPCPGLAGRAPPRAPPVHVGRVPRGGWRAPRSAPHAPALRVEERLGGDARRPPLAEDLDLEGARARVAGERARHITL